MSVRSFVTEHDVLKTKLKKSRHRPFVACPCLQIVDAYISKVVYQWRLEEPIQLNFVIFNDILQQHRSRWEWFCERWHIPIKWHKYVYLCRLIVSHLFPLPYNQSEAVTARRAGSWECDMWSINKFANGLPSCSRYLTFLMTNSRPPPRTIISHIAWCSIFSCQGNQTYYLTYPEVLPYTYPDYSCFSPPHLFSCHQKCAYMFFGTFEKDVFKHFSDKYSSNGYVLPISWKLGNRWPSYKMLLEQILEKLKRV